MLAVVTNLPGWRVASPASDLEKAPDADWPLYPTTLPVLPVMFGLRTSQVASLATKTAAENSGLDRAAQPQVLFITSATKGICLMRKVNIATEEALAFGLHTPSHPMDRHRPSSQLQPVCSSASKLDAVNEAERCRLNGTRRTVYGVGVFSIDVDDGIITVAIRTARANACPVTSCCDRHCTAVRNTTRAATGIAKIRLAKAIHIPRRRSSDVRSARTSRDSFRQKVGISRVDKVRSTFVRRVLAVHPVVMVRLTRFL